MIRSTMGTDQAWRQWGITDPYFGVLTDPRFRADAIADNRNAFFESGELSVTDILDTYEQHFGALPSDSALDFGCGVGRLTLALARRFDRVVGLDISEAMLSEARANAIRSGQPHANFLQSDANLSNASGKFDFVNSLIVLQHIPQRRGMSLIAKLLDKIAPGGGCMIHVSIKRNAQGIRRVAYLVRQRLPFGNALVNIATGQPHRQAAMQMNEYSATDVLGLFAAAGMVNTFVTLVDHGGVMTMAVYAKK